MSASDLLGTKMLLATDGSEEAELATRAAIELAEGAAGDRGVGKHGPRGPGGPRSREEGRCEGEYQRKGKP